VTSNTLTPQRLTIAIPTYNRNNLLRNLLESLAHQDDGSFDVLIIDNGSSPPVLDDLSLPYRLRYFKSPLNHLPSAYNLGWKLAETEIVCYCDDDVTFPPTWLGAIRELIADYPEAAAWGGPSIELGYRRTRAVLGDAGFVGRFGTKFHNSILMEGRGDVIGAVSRYGAYSTTQFPTKVILAGEAQACQVDQLSTVNVAVRRGVVQSLGGFCEDFHLGHSDGDLFMRLRGAGHQLVMGSRPYVYHHIGSPAPNRSVQEQSRNLECFLAHIRARDPSFKTRLGQWILRLTFASIMLYTEENSPVRVLRNLLIGLGEGSRDYRSHGKENRTRSSAQTNAHPSVPVKP
jgi:GT2 family glycosyltransferase